MPAVAQWIKNLSHKAAKVKSLTPLYDAQLGSGKNIPVTSFLYPADLWGGDAGRGRWIINGQLDIRGQRIPINTQQWLIGSQWQDTPYFELLHGFEWLSDLKALGGHEGRMAARALTAQWLDHFGRYDPVTWDPEITAIRTLNWLKSWAFAFAQADDDMIERMRNALGRHINHMKQTLQTNTVSPETRFIIEIVLQCVSKIPTPDDFHDTYHLVFDSDGGLQTRQLEKLIKITKLMVQLRQSWGSQQTNMPQWFENGLEKSLRLINGLTLNDKNLCSLQGGLHTHKQIITKMIQLCQLRIRRHDAQWKDAGFTTIRKGRSTLVIDHGDYTNPNTHLSPLAFEFSHGHANHGGHIFTSCGAHYADLQWQKSCAGPAAHCTLMVDGYEPSRMANPIKNTHLEKMNGAAIFSASHHMYQKTLHLTHTRRLYLDESGEDLRGEDLLTSSQQNVNHVAVLRFHLHPSVQTSYIQHGDVILIRLPDGSGWTFQCDLDVSNLTLEPSIFTAQTGFNIRKTNQIVLTSGMHDVAHTIKWSLKRA